MSVWWSGAQAAQGFVLDMLLLQTSELKLS